MSLQAYQQAAARTENPRDAEYRLFGQVTRALLQAAAVPPEDIARSY
jgi:flagellar protein FlaF